MPSPRAWRGLITVAGADRVQVDPARGPNPGMLQHPVDELTTVCWQTMHHEAHPERVVVSRIGNAKGRPTSRVWTRLESWRAGGTQCGRAQVLNLIGEVEGMNAILVDDEIDTAGSITQAAATVMEGGAKTVYACCAHAVLSGPAIDRLRDSPIRELVTTDTVPTRPKSASPTSRS